MAAAVDDDVLLTSDPLDLARAQKAVTHPSAGGVSLFVGTTRDNFDGKRVTHLEYEAYGPMAVAKMRELCAQARAKWADIVGVALYHRLGTVPTAEASVVVAVSTPHRRDAIEACQYLIDQLKATVPIWKKEMYDDGSAWKANPEAFNPSS